MSESVAVTLTTTGSPVRLTWRGRTWHVAADPVRWYERRPWWRTAARAKRYTTVGLVDTELWQVQVRLNSRSALRTVYLTHDRETGRWTIQPATADTAHIA